LSKNADIAMFQAKESGGNGVQVFELQKSVP
jgi:GGDEF domain-containing protein